MPPINKESIIIQKKNKNQIAPKTPLVNVVDYFASVDESKTEDLVKHYFTCVEKVSKSEENYAKDLIDFKQNCSDLDTHLASIKTLSKNGKLEKRLLTSNLLF